MTVPPFKALAAFAMLVAGIAVLVVIPAVSSGASERRGSTVVSLGDNYFLPAELTVRKGTLVQFNWVGDNEHDVIKKRGPGNDFESGVYTEPGIHFQKMFRRVGTYRIVCDVHKPEMKLRLVVKS